MDLASHRQPVHDHAGRTHLSVKGSEGLVSSARGGSEECGQGKHDEANPVRAASSSPSLRPIAARARLAPTQPRAQGPAIEAQHLPPFMYFSAREASSMSTRNSSVDCESGL